MIETHAFFLDDKSGVSSILLQYEEKLVEQKIRNTEK